MISVRRLPVGWARLPRLSGLDLLGVVAFLMVGVTLAMAFLYAPFELTQGDPQRVFYVHLPMAIAAYLSFLVVFVASILYLWKRSIKHDILARSAAEVGVLFLTLVIISGGFWGLGTWGTFWQWEPRLTFTFILWLIYVAYMMLRHAADDRERMARYAAVLGIIGFIDVPLIFMSVYLWRGLHPEPAGMPRDIAVTFLVGLVAFVLLFVYLVVRRYRIDRERERIEDFRASLEEAS